MNRIDLAAELSRAALEIDAIGDLDRSRLLQLARSTIHSLRSQLPSGDGLRGEALDDLLVRLRSASHRSANNEGQEVALLLLDAALAIRTVVSVQHEVVVERGREAGTPTQGSG
jgi:hypothetical protein